MPLDSYQLETSARPGTPGAVIEELTAALTSGIEELTRPVDAIKHQAKTVTVGISPVRRGTAHGAARGRDASTPERRRDRFSYRTVADPRIVWIRPSRRDGVPPATGSKARSPTGRRP